MRLFIAINFNDETKSRLLALRDELRGNSKHGKFSPPENLHLTLAFLGECGAKQITDVKAAMDAVVFQPFDLVMERTGRFKRGEGDVWWAGVHEAGALMDLQRGLADRLIAAGFTLDKCRYSPHVTLGREIVTDSAPCRIPPFGETVSSIELMKSERIQGKLIYTVIHAKGSDLAQCLE